MIITFQELKEKFAKVERNPVRQKNEKRGTTIYHYIIDDRIGMIVDQNTDDGNYHIVGIEPYRQDGRSVEIYNYLLDLYNDKVSIDISEDLVGNKEFTAEGQLEITEGELS